jgi:lipopolysaccharide export system permease protein
MLLPYFTGVFAVILMLVGNTLFGLVDIILKNNIPLVVVARLVVFNLPTLIVLTLPVGVALAAALAVNRMARDSEITPIRMGGVPLLRIFAPIFIVGLLSSAFSFWLGDSVVPPAERAFQKTQAAMFGYSISASPSLVANRVFTYQGFEFYVRDAVKLPGSPNSLLAHDIMLYENPDTPGGFPKLITAKSATYSQGLWKLHQVIVHTLDEQGFTRLEVFGKNGMLDVRAPLPVISDNSGGLEDQPDSYTRAQLASQIAIMHRTGQDATALEVAYHFKLALPFLCLAFALCAPPLSLRFARAGSFIGIFLSIVMVFVAWNTLLLTKALGLSGHMSPVLAAWSPDILFALLGLYFLWRME